MKTGKKEEQLKDKKQPPIFGEEDLVVNCLSLYAAALQVEQDGLVDSIGKKQETLRLVGEKLLDLRKAIKQAEKSRDIALAAKKKA